MATVKATPAMTKSTDAESEDAVNAGIDFSDAMNSLREANSEDVISRHTSVALNLLSQGHKPANVILSMLMADALANQKARARMDGNARSFLSIVPDNELVRSSLCPYESDDHIVRMVLTLNYVQKDFLNPSDNLDAQMADALAEEVVKNNWVGVIDEVIVNCEQRSLRS